MELQTALENRYSCRNFLPKEVTREQILTVLEAGRIAPTARNDQPQRLFVVTGEENLAKIDDCTPCRYGAPIAIIVGFDAEGAFMHDVNGEKWSYGNADSTSVLVHMLLKATDIGLATCWVGMYDDSKMYANFPELEGTALRAIVMLGYPSEKGAPSPRHAERKPLEETVTWL